jgi:hypothetical protein
MNRHFAFIQEQLLFAVLLFFPLWFFTMTETLHIPVLLLWVGYGYAMHRLSWWAIHYGHGGNGAIIHKKDEQAIADFLKWAVEERQVRSGSWDGEIKLKDNNQVLYYDINLNITTDLSDAADYRRSANSGDD